MTAITELAVDVGTSAACQALCMPRDAQVTQQGKPNRGALAQGQTSVD
jgi:hypothetical protein